MSKDRLFACGFRAIQYGCLMRAGRLLGPEWLWSPPVLGALVVSVCAALLADALEAAPRA